MDLLGSEEERLVVKQSTNGKALFGRTPLILHHDHLTAGRGIASNVPQRLVDDPGCTISDGSEAGLVVIAAAWLPVGWSMASLPGHVDPSVALPAWTPSGCPLQ